MMERESMWTQPNTFTLDGLKTGEGVLNMNTPVYQEMAKNDEPQIGLPQ